MQLNDGLNLLGETTEGIRGTLMFLAFQLD